MVSAEPNGPAARGGVQEGDLIVAVNGRDVTSIDDLHRLLAEWPLGSPVTLSVLRGQQRFQPEVFLREAGISR